MKFKLTCLFILFALLANAQKQTSIVEEAMAGMPVVDAPTLPTEEEVAIKEIVAKIKSHSLALPANAKSAKARRKAERKMRRAERRAKKIQKFLGSRLGKWLVRRAIRKAKKREKKRLRKLAKTGKKNIYKVKPVKKKDQVTKLRIGVGMLLIGLALMGYQIKLEIDGGATTELFFIIGGLLTAVALLLLNSALGGFF